MLEILLKTTIFNRTPQYPKQSYEPTRIKKTEPSRTYCTS